MTFKTQSGLSCPAKISSSENSNGNGHRANSRPIRILHIVNDLAIGGTEMMLYKVLSRTNRKKFESAVISLDGAGKLGDRIRELGIPVYAIGLKPSVLQPLSLLRFARTARRINADLIQGWMYHGNLAAQFAGLFTPRPVSIFWNIRQSLCSLEEEKPATANAIKLGARLSHWPTKILNNSRKSVAQHSAIGYQTSRTVVIPNGFDSELFAPSEEARHSVRGELGVSHDTFLIGLIGRYHPLKGHSTFLRAASLLLKDYTDAQFVLAGKGVDWNNESLREQIQQLGMVERVHLLGERLDMPRLTAALDLASSSSYDEGFPNVIGEAMSCGIPCVVTDVSDLRWIVGGTGRVVPPRNPEAMGAEWKKLIEIGRQERTELGLAARARVTEWFSLSSVVEQYEALYESAVSQRTTETASAIERHHLSEPVLSVDHRNHPAESISNPEKSASLTAGMG
jgi:glycosyltransferase involved in cell wall biosynthesis